jgi:hypothetical protein
MYAHLMKFEKPIKTATGAVAETARDYSYLTDASYNILFDDGSKDSLGSSNGSQTYVAQRLLKVGQVSETTQAKATSMSLTIDSTALSTTLSPTSTTISTTDATITLEESWIEAGFTEGDKLRISSNDGNNGKFIIINSFQNDNKKIGITGETGYVAATDNSSYTFTVETEEYSSPFMDKEDSSYAHYINREVFIYKALIDPSTGTVVGPTAPSSGTYVAGPFLIFKGIIASVKVKEDPAKSSEVVWTLTSHWGDFVSINGRLTSDTEHRGINGQGENDYAALIRPEYVNDLGFMHSEQAINLISTYKATETYYTFRKTGFLGLGKGKTEEKTRLVDREIDLKFNLDARRLPVVYGVNRLDSFPIFVDLDRSNTADVYAGYALCEGEIAGLYDIYLDNNSRICADVNDEGARSGNSEAVSVVCEGRKDRGDTLKSKVFDTSSAGIAIAGPGFSAYIPDINKRGGMYEQYVKNTEGGYDLQSSYGNADLDPTTGIPHEEGHNFTSPIEGRIIFHRGKPDQKADNMLVKKAAESGTDGGFMLQHQYFEDTEKSNYWGPNHRLLDTAYVVANYNITEDELEIPELEFVVRGRVLPSYDYDFSYRKDPKQTSAAATAFQFGQTLNLYKTSNAGVLQTGIVIADFYTYIDEDGEEHQKWRFASAPDLGTTTAFYMSTAATGADKWYFNTYDHELISSTNIDSDLTVGISSFANNSSSGVDITLADESGHGEFIAKVIDYVGQVAPVAVSGTIAEVNAKLHFSVLNADSVSTGTRVLQGISNFTDGWSTSTYNKVRVPKSFIIVGGNTNEDYYKGLSVQLTRTKTDGTKVVQERTITKNKVIDGKVVALVDQDWEVDGSSDFSLEPATFTGITGRTADKFKIKVKKDTRVSINPTLQLLDYITNKRYGKGLDIEKDIDLESFKTVARLCDTRSDVTVILPSSASLVEGVNYKYTYGGNTFWQGVVKEVTTVTYAGTSYKQAVFTDCIGKLAHRWFDWKVYNQGEIIYHHKKGRAFIHTGATDLVSEPTSGFANNSAIALTKVSGTGDSSVNIWLGIFSGDGDAQIGSISYEGNPVIKQSGNTGFTDSGYSLYDSDDVKYWRYLGWQSQNQREVTRHQACPIIDTNVSVFENINSLLAHFNGILRYSNGKYELDIQSASTLEGYSANDPRIIRESDIVGAITVEDSGQKQSKNTVTVGFPDPQQEYGERSVTYFDSNYLAEDRNIPKKEDIKTPWILNYYNTRINAKQYLEQSRYGKKINFVMEPKGALLLAGTIIQVSYPRFGWGSDDLLVKQYLNQTTTTYEPHGFKVGDIVRYEDITNTTESVNTNYNNNYFTITGVTSTTFTTDQNTTSGTTVSTNCGKVYKKGEYFRISNLNFREDCSVQVTAIEHNDKSYLISKRRNDIIGAVQPGTGSPEAPGAPSGLTAVAVEEAKAIKVSWTNNANAYKTVAGVTKWRDSWATEIWVNNQPSFTATDETSYDQKFANGAILLERKEHGQNDFIYTPEGEGTQTRYHWVRHVAKHRVNTIQQIELSSVFQPLSNAFGVSASCTGSVAVKTIEIEPTNGVLVTYQGTERVMPVSNLAFKVKLNNFDSSKKWYYRYYITAGAYLLSSNATSGSNTGDNQYKGVHHWSGSSNSTSYDEFTLHSNFEPKSKAAQSTQNSVILHVEVFELDDTNGITSSDTSVSTTNIALSSINIARPQYEVDFTQGAHTFYANSNGTADVTGFATTPKVYRNDNDGRVELTYEKYSSTAGATTFSYGDNTNENTPQTTNSEDGVTGTNCNPTVNTSNGAITLDASDNSGIANGPLTSNTASILIQIKDNKAIKNGLRTTESDITYKTINLFKIPNPIRDGSTYVVDVSDDASDNIDSDFFTDFVATGNLTETHAQHAAAYVISKSADGFIRSNDILTVTNGTGAQGGSRIFTGTSGTSDSTAAGPGNWSSKVVEVFAGSVIVDGTLSADQLSANSTFTKSLKVGSDLIVGSNDNAGSTMAGQINTPNKPTWASSGDGFFINHEGKVWIGNDENYLKYDGAGNFSILGSLDIAGTAGENGASTGVLFIRKESGTPTKPLNTQTSLANAATTVTPNWSTSIPTGNTHQLWATTGTRAAHAPDDANDTKYIWEDPVQFEGPEGPDSEVEGPAGPTGPGMYQITGGASTNPTQITAALIKGATGRSNAGGFGYSVKGDICTVKYTSGGSTSTKTYTCITARGSSSAETDTYTSTSDQDNDWDQAEAFITGELVVNGSIATQKLSIISDGASDSGIFASGTGGNSKIEVKEFTGGEAKTRVVIGYLGS